jgi:two-component system response regulator FixJ
MHSKEDAAVCVIDDEEAVRDLARQILNSHGITVRSYASAEEFLADFDESTTSCVVTDLRMPKIDGLQLQHHLSEIGSLVSMVVVTGYADVRTAVRLMQDGAVTLLEKPYEPANLIAAVERAIARTQARRERHEEFRRAKAALAKLTDEERSVLDGILAGLPNKTIALRLDISLRTVDRRRQAIFTKTAVRSDTELATLVARLNSQEQ